MAGRLALRTEIVSSLHQAHPKELLPETVDRHPRGQRVFRGHQPSGQIEPVGNLPSLLHHRENRRHCTAHFFAGCIVLTAHHDEAVAGLVHVPPDEGLRNLILEFVPLLT